jgi:hypothetical protein
LARAGELRPLPFSAAPGSLLFPERFIVRISFVPTETPFHKKPTFVVAIICMLVFLGVMVFSSGTGGHVRKLEAKSLVNARQICLACRAYSREHGGVFPPSLDALFPKYLQDRAALASPLSPADSIGYTYTPPPPAKTDSPDTIVLEDKFAPAIAHERLVVFANGSAGPVPIPAAN